MEEALEGGADLARTGHVEAHGRALRAADPVALHRAHLLGPIDRVEVVGEALGEAEESSEESPLFSAMIAMTAMSITTMTAAIAPIMRPVFGPFFFGCPP